MKAYTPISQRVEVLAGLRSRVCLLLAFYPRARFRGVARTGDSLHIGSERLSNYLDNRDKKSQKPLQRLFWLSAKSD